MLSTFISVLDYGDILYCHAALTLDIPHVCTNVGRTGFRCYAPFKWNELQTDLKLLSFLFEILKLYSLLFFMILVTVLLILC